MRERLIKYVKKQFGPTYGSAEMKELRGEIARNAPVRESGEARSQE